METNKMYQCAICGKEYNNIEDRAECESNCLKQLKIDKQKKKDAENKAAEIAGVQVIRDELSKADKMIREHLEKYESINIADMPAYYYLSLLLDKKMFNRKFGWWF